MFNLEQLESKNIIEVNDKVFNQLSAVKDSLKKNGDKVKLDINFFIMEGVQKFINEDKSRTYTYFKINENTKICYLEMYFYNNDDNKLNYLGSNTFSLITQRSHIKMDKRMKSLIGAAKLNEAIDYHKGEFLMIFQYFTYILDNRETIVKTERKNKNVDSNINNNNQQKDIINNRNIKVDNSNNRSVINIKQNKIEYKLILDEEAKKQFKQTYIRHVESWQVRGYERHLKSGKVIYIKPFVKGTGKNIKPKTYKV